MTQTHTLHLTLADQAENRYPTVPFELHGAESFEVRLRHDRDQGVIDLGCEAPSRWCGWSGGARESFVVTTDAATPGYLPGIEDGTWQVVLGLHVLPAEGLDVTVEIDVPATRPVEQDVLADVVDAPRGSARNLPAPPGLTWFAGDFHAHTVHSDGNQSISQLAAAAVARGLDFLAVADHNTTSHFAHLEPMGRRHDITLIPAQEVTTHRGHANVFGDVGWVDFRTHPDQWLKQASERGGLMSVNHAVDGDCAWQWHLAQLPHLLEFWHISWFRDLRANFPWAVLELWQQRTRALGQPDPVLIGGSDFHRPEQGWPPGTPTTWVCARDRSVESLLAAVAAGRTAISRFPGEGEPIVLRSELGFHVLDADGCVLVDQSGNRTVIDGDRVLVPLTPEVVRLEAADRTVLAVC